MTDKKPYFESYEDFHRQLGEGMKANIQAMVDRGATITISPFQDPRSRSERAWGVLFSSGKNRIGSLMFNMLWGEVLDWCDALAKVIPNSKIKID